MAVKIWVFCIRPSSKKKKEKEPAIEKTIFIFCIISTSFTLALAFLAFLIWLDWRKGQEFSLKDTEDVLKIIRRK